ncbi:MAG: TetR family transcriptional regulator, partial [Bacilli bacterium]|nr:TetR family transcriptional regulator [Bacilli bacterium]
MKNRILDRTYMLKKIPDFHLASLKEFGAKRFSEASLNQIIKDARTNKGSFYYRFPDKRELYFALLDDLFVTLQINIEAKNQSTGSDNDIESKFGCFLDALYECYVENQDYLSLAYNLYHETDELKRDVLDNCIPSPYDQLLAATINLLYSDSVSPDINEVSIKEVAYRLYCIPDFLGLHFTITEFEVYKTRTLNWLRSTSNSMKASILPDSNDVIASDSVNAEKFDLRGLSLYKGDVIGIIGNHASGKTSLIKCLHEKTCTQLFEGENCVALISPEDFYARSNKL